jgi:HrpA-like RNA helicase
MILYSVALECLDPCLTIAAALSLGKSPFYAPFGAEAESNRSRDTFKRDDSDLMTIANAFDSWRAAYLDESIDIRLFCQEKYFSHANMSLIEETRGQLLRLLIGVRTVGRDVIDARRFVILILTAGITESSKR